jgi:hypothetical protein
MVGMWAGCRNSLCGSSDAGLRGSGVASEGFPAGLLSGIKSPCRKCTDTEPPKQNPRSLLLFAYGTVPGEF